MRTIATALHVAVRNERRVVVIIKRKGGGSDTAALIMWLKGKNVGILIQ
jgi:hypothetical protein